MNSSTRSCVSRNCFPMNIFPRPRLPVNTKPHRMALRDENSTLRKCEHWKLENVSLESLSSRMLVPMITLFEAVCRRLLFRLHSYSHPLSSPVVVNLIPINHRIWTFGNNDISTSVNDVKIAC